MNQKSPKAAATFMMATILVSLFVLAWSLATAVFPWHQIPLFLILTVAGGMAHLYPIGSAGTNQATYVVANTFLFAGIMLLDPGWLVLLCIGLWVPKTIQRYQERKQDWLLIPAANAAQSLIAAIGAYMLIGQWALPSLLDVGLLLLVIPLFVLFQTLWVAMVVHLFRGTPLRSLDFWHRDGLISDAVLLLLGSVLALLWQVHPVLVVLVLGPVAFAYYMLRNVQLIRLGELDGKTGLYNARRLEEEFQRNLTSAKVLRRNLSAIFLDMDFLRSINNTYGHLAGDAAIGAVAQAIKGQTRSGDFAARFGGEEFVVLLPGTDLAEAGWIAERIRRAVAETPVDMGDGRKIFCTVSGGVASFPTHGTTVAQLTEAADEALYYAKEHGRNRIHLAPVAAQQNAAPQPAASAVQPSREEMPEERTHPANANVVSSPAITKAGRRPSTPAERTVIAAGALGLLLALLVGAFEMDVRLLTGLCILGFAAEYWKVELLHAGDSKPSVSFGVGVTMAAAAMLGMVAALCVNAANLLAHLVLSRRVDPVNLAANLSILILSAVAGSLPFLIIHGEAQGQSLAYMTAAVAGSVLYFAVNFGLVSWVLSHKQQRPVGELWRQMGWMAPNYMLTALSGGLIGMTYETVGWYALPVFLLPVLVMRHTYQTHIRRSEEAYQTAEKGRCALEEAHAIQQHSIDQLIEVISLIIDARDAAVYGHSGQVARYAVAIAAEMHLPEEAVARIRWAGLLHDLGKLGIPEAILNKPARLTPEEWETMRQHASIGERILRTVPGLEEIARMVGEHHEMNNGTGYPYGRAGEEISLGARILALADALDSILSDRPYASARPLDWAIREIEKSSGRQFDPTVVAAFLRLVAKHGAQYFSGSSSDNRCRLKESAAGRQQEQ